MDRSPLSLTPKVLMASRRKQGEPTFSDDEGYAPIQPPQGQTPQPLVVKGLSYDTEKIDFFVGLAFVMTLVTEGTLSAFLHHRGVAVAYTILGAVELLVTCIYYMFSMFSERQPHVYKKIYTFIQAPIMLALFGFIIWAAVEIAQGH